MAHFAELNDENVVLRVIVVDNSDCGGGDFPESEPIGVEFCSNLLGGKWIQTSYNANFRKNYASVDYTFDKGRDAFIPPQPHENWVLDGETCKWIPPIPRPTDGDYLWNQERGIWDKII